MKKFNVKEITKKKHGITALAMVLGVVMLTGSVYANYDDAKGYSTLKKNVKNLILEEDNFSFEANLSVDVDGREISTGYHEFKLDGKNSYSKNKDFDGQGMEEYSIKDIAYRKYDEDEEKGEDVYHKGHFYSFRDSLNENPNEVKKAVRFTELLADAVVGDLKNNFVIESKKEGERTYLIDVSGNQIPELINAGLGMTFGVQNMYVEKDHDDIDDKILYESRYKTQKNYFEKETGLDYDEYFYNFHEEGKSIDDEERWKEEEQWREKALEHYKQVFLDKAGDDKKGALVVRENGDYEYYDDLYLAMMEMANMGRMEYVVKALGTDPYISKGVCRYTVDKSDRMKDYELAVTISGKDLDGNVHSITTSVKGKVYDYGKTSVTFNPSEHNIFNDMADAEESVTVEVEKSVKVELE